MLTFALDIGKAKETADCVPGMWWRRRGKPDRHPYGTHTQPGRSRWPLRLAADFRLVNVTMAWVPTAFNSLRLHAWELGPRLASVGIWEGDNVENLNVLTYREASLHPPSFPFYCQCYIVYCYVDWLFFFTITLLYILHTWKLLQYMLNMCLTIKVSLF